MPPDRPTSTEGAEYARRMHGLESAWWRRVLPVQAPYRWNIRRIATGRVLDVGCGAGRNLAHLGGNGVGVDHNTELVAAARNKGFEAYTPAEFTATKESFDTLLLAHVVEHMDDKQADALIATYLPCVKPNGAIVFITPQEAGFKTDSTHVRFVGFDILKQHAAKAGCKTTRSYSFPFPRLVGRVFPYNEFVLVAKTDA